MASGYEVSVDDTERKTVQEDDQVNSPARVLGSGRDPVGEAGQGRGRGAGREVSIVIPASRWDHHLEATLRSVGSQELPDDVRLEVLVALADARPSDPPSDVVLVENPAGSIPAGLNRAIAASSGNVVVRVDARCNISPTHVSRILDALGDPSVGCVGGAALVLDRGLFGSTYALAFNSVLLGPTVYRYRRTSGVVDTAYLGAWRRADLESLGGFDERLLRNQDNELSDRVRASGMKVWYDADLVVGYTNGRGLLASIRHHHDFGLWRTRQQGQGQSALTMRHKLALSALFATSVGFVRLVASPESRSVAWKLVAATYVSASMTATVSATRLRNARQDLSVERFHPAAPLLAPALAGALNAGWLAGLVRGIVGSRRAR